MMKICPKFSFGVGDRFAYGAHAKLTAFIVAKKLGNDSMPVWNKSNRECYIIGSEPLQTRAAADKGVSDLDWSGECLLGADHINLATVDRFVAPCEFFTLDMAAVCFRCLQLSGEYDHSTAGMEAEEDSRRIGHTLDFGN